MPHVALLEPHPIGQRPFLRGLKRAGCRISGIGTLPPTHFDAELRYLLDGYARVSDPASVEEVVDAVRRLGESGPPLDRLEATDGAFLGAAAGARAFFAIRGESAEVVAACALDRLAAHGIPTGPAGHGHQGYFDAIVVNGEIVYEAVTHFYPPSAEALADRSLRPVVVHTNRLAEDGYDPHRALHARVLAAVGVGTSATHLEWFHGEGGMWVASFGLHPPPWDLWELYCEGGDFDLHVEWARAIAFGEAHQRPRSRRAAGLVNLRPDRDGVISHYEGVEWMQRQYGSLVFRMHLPPASTPTQPIALGYHANAFVGLEHDDYDALRAILLDIGEHVHVFASEYVP